MRHASRAHHKLGKDSAHRLSMLTNLCKSIIEHEQIITTVPKAKALRPIIEKIVTMGKVNSLHTRRLLISKLRGCEESADKILSVLSPRFKERNGGYTRILKAGSRRGDNADMAVIEFVERDKAAKGKNDLNRVKLEREALQAQNNTNQVSAL